TPAAGAAPLGIEGVAGSAARAPCEAARPMPSARTTATNLIARPTRRRTPHPGPAAARGPPSQRRFPGLRALPDRAAATAGPTTSRCPRRPPRRARTRQRAPRPSGGGPRPASLRPARDCAPGSASIACARPAARRCPRTVPAPCSRNLRSPRNSHLLAQRMHGPRIVCLDAALAASHCSCSLRDVQSLEHPQHERFLLPSRQLRQAPFQSLHGLVCRQLLRGERRAVRNRRVLIRGCLASFVLRLQPGQPGHDPGLDAPPALTIANPVLQNAVEERAPFLARAAAVAACELEHRVLNAVEGVFVVPQSDAGH